MHRLSLPDSHIVQDVQEAWPFDQSAYDLPRIRLNVQHKSNEARSNCKSLRFFRKSSRVWFSNFTKRIAKDNEEDKEPVRLFDKRQKGKK